MNLKDSLLMHIYSSKGLGDIVALGAGAVKGYCSAQGIEMSPRILKDGLIVAPLLFQTWMGGQSGMIEAISDEDNRSYFPSALKGGVLGLGLGALEMGLGYCIGYTIGGLSR